MTHGDTVPESDCPERVDSLHYRGWLAAGSAGKRLC